MNFELVSKFQPTGDQPQAIKQIVDGLRQNLPYQTLQGVTGSKLLEKAFLIKSAQHLNFELYEVET